MKRAFVYLLILMVFSCADDNHSENKDYGIWVEFYNWIYHSTDHSSEFLSDFVLHNFSNDEEIEHELRSIIASTREVILSSKFTLGVYTSNYFEEVSVDSVYSTPEKIINDSIYIANGVNKRFHWKADIVNHIAPADLKKKYGLKFSKLSDLEDNQWLDTNENMTGEYLQYIMNERAYSVTLATRNLEALDNIKDRVDSDNYLILRHILEMTLFSTKLREQTSQMYFTFRIFKRGGEYFNPNVKFVLENSISGTITAANNILVSSESFPVEQYDWKTEAIKGLDYVHNITKEYQTP